MIKSLSLAILIPLALSPHAHADGLIYRLPPDGAWVLYRLEQNATFETHHPPDVQLAPHARDGMPKTGFVTGFLSLRSVGSENVNGAPCRWIELELWTQLAGQTTAGAEAARADRRIIMKLLIPEDGLREGQDPFKHVLRMRFKDGQRDPESIDDPQRRQYELDRFRPLFPEPAPDAKREPGQKLSTVSPSSQPLDCVKLTFPSRYDGPLAGGRGRWTYDGHHVLWLSNEVPFGVAALEFTSTSHETTGADGRMTVITKGTRHLLLATHGQGATSSLPEPNKTERN